MDKTKLYTLDRATVEKEYGSVKTAELHNRLDELEKQMAAAREESGDGDARDLTKAKSLKGDTAAEKANSLSEMYDRMAVIDEIINARVTAERQFKDMERLRERDVQEAETGVTASGTPIALGDRIVENEAYQSALNGQTAFKNLKFELPNSAKDFLNPQNAVFKTDAGYAPETLRSGRVVLQEQEALTLLDLLTQITTSTGAYIYMREKTAPAAAAARAEGAALAQDTALMEQISVSLKSIGSYLPVTDEQLSDEPAARQYINAALPAATRREVNKQALVGTGASNQMTGLNVVPGTGTYAKKSADQLVDAYFIARRTVRVAAKIAPNAVLVSPAEFERLMTLKATDNQYLYGMPAALGLDPRVAGMRVIEVDDVPANTAIVGNFGAESMALIVGGNVTIEFGSINDDFIRLQQSVRTVMRAELAVFKPKSLCRLTALNA